MNKKLFGFLNILIVGLAIGGCNATTETLSPVNPIEEKHIHLQEGTIHDVKVEDVGRAFISNKSSEYKLVVLNTQDIVRAANMISTHINNATGCKLPVIAVDDESTYEYNANDKCIYIGLSDVANKAGVVRSNIDLSFSGYEMATVKDSLFILTNAKYGYRYAALKLLREVVGFDCFSDKTYCYEKDGSTLPTMNGVEISDIEFYTPAAKIDETTSYEMGFNPSSCVFYSGIVKQHHNSLQYVPFDTYGASHPKWYASTLDQVCYTAHGDEVEYQALLDTTFEVIKKAIDDDPNCAAITFSIQDNPNICTCDACMANFEKYGAHSGSVVLFINDLDDMVQPYLEQKAIDEGTKKRNFNLSFFAYNKTEKPPVVKNADGTFSAAAPEVVCHEHVGPYIAPINASYSHSFYSGENESSAKNIIEGWGAISNNLYLWIYETNFTHYFFPLNSYESAIETYRFLRENNACYVFPEGQWNTATSTHFTNFKRYITSHGAYNVNTDFNTLVNQFFKYAYLQGSEYMLQFYNELVAYMNYLELEYPFEITGNIYNEIAKAQYWPVQLLSGWLNLTNQALDAIEPLKTTDESKYEITRKNILIESMFPRFALITLHPGKFSNEQLLEMQKSFKADSISLGMSMENEASLLSDLFDVWGV